MHRRVRKIGTASVAVVATLVLASCGAGLTGPVAGVSDSGATLTGTVLSTIVGPTEYWFEYGTTPELGSTTPVESLQVDDTAAGYPVELAISGLASETTYHYRLCVRATDGYGLCGASRTFTTAAPRDTVSGYGLVFFYDGGGFPQLSYRYEASVSESSHRDGTDPTGFASTSPSFYHFRLADAGAVTCLRVEGTRAAIGFMGAPQDFGLDPVARMIFIEDNGPNGDLMTATFTEAPATTCPVPTASDLTPGSFGGQPIGPHLASGGFTVHDAP